MAVRIFTVCDVGEKKRADLTPNWGLHLVMFDVYPRTIDSMLTNVDPIGFLCCKLPNDWSSILFILQSIKVIYNQESFMSNFPQPRLDRPFMFTIIFYSYNILYLFILFGICNACFLILIKKIIHQFHYILSSIIMEMCGIGYLKKNCIQYMHIILYLLNA